MPGHPPAANTLRVAIVGSGPAAFYAAEALLDQSAIPVHVDMFERLPTPFGLVRHGVAPDHQRIKNVTKVFAATAAHPNFRFYGNITFGDDITLDDFRRHYHQAIFATGAQTDRRLNIPGEDLPGSHAATEFVAWYNGHPDYSDRQFDLSGESAVIIGVGNVALDVARILSHSRDELETTDMAPHAIDALAASSIREVHLVGRRGPAQAAFSNPEIKELSELGDADVVVPPDEATLDPISAELVATTTDRTLKRKVRLIDSLAAHQTRGHHHRLNLRFLISPIEFLPGDDGKLAAIRFARNRLEHNDAGSIVPRPTGEEITIPATIAFRSVGYRGVPLPGIPFREDWAVIPNRAGRILAPETSDTIPGLYTAGWIKRGPSGVIGTNKPDAVETVTAMLHDARVNATLDPTDPSPEAIDHLLRQRATTPVRFPDWQRIDAIEIERGQPLGRPRVKFSSIDEMLAALRPR